MYPGICPIKYVRHLPLGTCPPNIPGEYNVCHGNNINVLYNMYLYTRPSYMYAVATESSYVCACKQEGISVLFHNEQKQVGLYSIAVVGLNANVRTTQYSLKCFISYNFNYYMYIIIQMTSIK